MQNPNREKQACRMYIASLLIVGTIGVVRRYIPLSSGLLAFARGLIGALSLSVFVLLRGGRIGHGLPGRKLGALVVTGIALSFNWMLLFEAYTYTTVATATLCYYFAPTIVVLLSPLLFRERLSAKKLICAGLAVLGMILVSGVLEQGSAKSGQMRGVLFGLGAACFYAMVVILNKKITDVDPYERTVVELLASAAAMIPYLLLTEDVSQLHIDAKLIGFVLLVGVVYTGLVYALYFGSIEYLRAQSLAILSYLDPVVALLVSALVLGERLTTAGMIGAVLILGAAVVSEWEPTKGNNS